MFVKRCTLQSEMLTYPLFTARIGEGGSRTNKQNHALGEPASGCRRFGYSMVLAAMDSFIISNGCVMRGITDSVGPTPASVSTPAIRSSLWTQ